MIHVPLTHSAPQPATPHRRHLTPVAQPAAQPQPPLGLYRTAAALNGRRGGGSHSTSADRPTVIPTHSRVSTVDRGGSTAVGSRAQPVLDRFISLTASDPRLDSTPQAAQPLDGVTLDPVLNHSDDPDRSASRLHWAAVAQPVTSDWTGVTRTPRAEPL